ncbi:MAG: transposase [Chloroflexota bacterium]
MIVQKMYKYRLYRCDKKDRKLRHKLFVASTIWNHFVALQRRYYRLTGKYISLHDMNKHVLKLRKRPAFALWRDLHSQVCQNVCRRVDDAYQRFFKGLAKGRPKFKKARKYSSFTFPQSGYKVDGNHLTVDGTTYRFVKHREIGGQIKTLTVKRDPVGRLWLVFSVVEEQVILKSSTGKSGGFDFGLKIFLTDDEGRPTTSPQFFAQNIRKTRRLNRQLSHKVEGSHRYKRAKRVLAKHSVDVANQRREHHFQLAHRLCDEYDTLYFEDLNLAGMKALWGRKVSDLGFSSFLNILEWVALKRGKSVVKIGRFERTTGKCSGCGHLQKLKLRERTFHCDSCGLVLDRDWNAAMNILRVGTSTPYESESKTRVRLRARVDSRSLRL